MIPPDPREAGNGVEPLFPRWAASWGTLARGNALVRSQCRSCGIQHRVDASVQALRFGASASPVDQFDPCTIVGCHGSAFYLVARTYGRQWIVMLARGELRAAIGSAAPAANAVSLDLIGHRQPVRQRRPCGAISRGPRSHARPSCLYGPYPSTSR